MINVMLNGKILARVKERDAKRLVKKLRDLRRKGQLHPEVTVAYIAEREEVRIDTKGGRVLRPLIVVKNGKPLLTEDDVKKLEEGKLTWDDLLAKGKIEFLDTEEEEDALIAVDEKELTPEHTHLELHPVSLLGIPGSLIPYANYSRGDRVNTAPAKG